MQTYSYTHLHTGTGAPPAPPPEYALMETDSFVNINVLGEGWLKSVKVMRPGFDQHDGVLPGWWCSVPPSIFSFRFFTRNSIVEIEQIEGPPSRNMG